MNEVRTRKKLKMSVFWILFMTFSTMYTVHPGRRWVTAQSATEPTVSQPDKELTVDIGDSATLQCCISGTYVGLIAWFKQAKRKTIQGIVSSFRTAGETFYHGFQKSHFQIKRSSNCFNLAILNITQSDEAMYYCAVTYPTIEFGNGTYLEIKGENVNTTSKPALCDHPAECEQTSHRNSANIMNTQEKTALGLGIALGICTLLVFCLTYFILSGRKNDPCTINTSVENGPETRQEYRAETLNYAAVQFSRQKVGAHKKKTGSANECVYSDVNKTVRCNRNNSN